MNLTEKYLEEVQMINGIFVLQVPRNTPQHDQEQFHKEWKKFYPDETLLIIYDDVKISKIHKYSFYLAMMLVRQGKRITRLDWIKQYGGHKNAPYLTFDDSEASVDLLILRFPGTNEKDEFFFVSKEDMDSEDYVLQKEYAYESS